MPGLKAATAAYLLVPKRHVSLARIVLVDDEAFVLFSADVEGAIVREFGLFRREEGKWIPKEFTEGWKRTPARGSGEMPLAAIIGEEWGGIGGYVDPTISRVASVAPSGSTVDADTPIGGGTIVLAQPGALLTAYRGTNLISATPVVGQMLPQDEPSIDEGARELADEFLKALTSPNDNAIAEAMFWGTLGHYFIPSLRRILSTPPQSVPSIPGGSPGPQRGRALRWGFRVIPRTLPTPAWST